MVLVPTRISGMIAENPTALLFDNIITENNRLMAASRISLFHMIWYLGNNYKMFFMCHRYLQPLISAFSSIIQSTNNFTFRGDVIFFNH